jgi:hypothetical protein
MNMTYDMARHSMMGAFASMESLVARRLPTIAELQWGHVSIVKTAAIQSNGVLCHVFAIVMFFVSEKVTDAHGMRVAVLNPTGDSNYMMEQKLVGEPCVTLGWFLHASDLYARLLLLQVASDHMVRHALHSGVITENSLTSCKLGKSVEMEPGVEDM